MFTPKIPLLPTSSAAYKISTRDLVTGAPGSPMSEHSYAPFAFLENLAAKLSPPLYPTESRKAFRNVASLGSLNLAPYFFPQHSQSKI